MSDDRLLWQQALFLRIQRDEHDEQERELRRLTAAFRLVLDGIVARGSLSQNDLGALADVRETLARFENISIPLVDAQVADLSAAGRLFKQMSMVLESAYTVGRYSALGSDQKGGPGRDPSPARDIRAVRVEARSEIVWQCVEDFWNQNRALQGNCYQAVYGSSNIFSAANASLEAASQRTYSLSGMHAMLKREWAKRTAKLNQ